jgi:hypothetical protein
VEYSFYEVLYPDYFYGFSAINMFVDEDKGNCLCHTEILLRSLEFKLWDAEYLGHPRTNVLNVYHCSCRTHWISKVHDTRVMNVYHCSCRTHSALNRAVFARGTKEHFSPSLQAVSVAD